MNLSVIIDLLLLSIICVLIIDKTDAIYSLKKGLSWIKYFRGRKLFGKNYKPSADFRLKPLDCSLCSTVWSCIGYLLYTNNLTISYLTLVLGVAVFTPVTKALIDLVMDMIITTIKFIQNMISRL